MSAASHIAAGDAGAAADDLMLPFKTERSGISGRLVRLGTSVDTILTCHDYPEPVGEALGHALALTAMLGSALKTEGKLALQTRTDGAVNFIIADYEAPGRLRGYASFDPRRLNAQKPESIGVRQGRLLGSGHLALTVDPGGGQDRKQGIVALDGNSIAAAALAYFRQSEQIPTYLRLALARHYTAGTGGAAGVWSWRAGGLMIQHLNPAPGATDVSGDDTLTGDSDEEWQRVRILAATVEDHELLDPLLSSEQLLLRLFHEEGVRVFRPQQVEMHCRCSRERVRAFLVEIGPDQLADMTEPDGGYSVKCEFCSTTYRFEPGEIG